MSAFLDNDLAQYLPLLIGLAAGLMVVAIGLVFGQWRNRRTVQLRATESGDLPEVLNLRRDDSDSSIASFDRAVKRWLPRRQMLRDRLFRTGRNIPIGQFLLSCAVLTLVVAVALIKLFKFAPILALLIAFVAGVGLPYLLIGMMGNRRLDKFNRQFPDAIDIMVRGLRAGMPMHDSIQVVAQEIADPVGTEFRKIDQAVTLGQPMDVALTEAAKRITVQEFQFFVVSLALQRETGGNLAETLANLSDILRRRRQMRLKIKAMSSEARASAWIIGLLPFIMFAILMTVNAPYVMKLFQDTRGLIMTGVGLTSIGLGVLVMNKMMRFEI
jgi:tight adherence protein B